MNKNCFTVGVGDVCKLLVDDFLMFHFFLQCSVFMDVFGDAMMMMMSKGCLVQKKGMSMLF